MARSNPAVKEGNADATPNKCFDGDNQSGASKEARIGRFTQAISVVALTPHSKRLPSTALAGGLHAALGRSLHLQVNLIATG